MAKLNFASIRLAGYYYDTEKDQIYSTKCGKARAITWRTCPPRNESYAQLTDTSGNKVRVLKAHIYIHLKNESNTGSQQTAKPQQGLSTGSYIVVAISEGALCPSSNPKSHETEASARAEAERLAIAYPNLKFRVFKDCGTVQARSVVWG